MEGIIERNDSKIFQRTDRILMLECIIVVIYKDETPSPGKTRWNYIGVAP